VSRDAGFYFCLAAKKTQKAQTSGEPNFPFVILSEAKNPMESTIRGRASYVLPDSSLRSE
jgi:hypothetical protein